MDLQLIHKKDAERHTWTEGRNTRKESFSYDSVCGHASDVYPFIEKKEPFSRYSGRTVLSG